MAHSSPRIRDTVSAPASPRARTLRERLRSETATAHRALETRLDLLGPALSFDRYRHTLQRFFGFYLPCEAQLARSVPAAPPLGVALAARADLLARDLAALGMPPAAIAALPRCSALPGAGRLEHFAGCFYVLEGASLGGQVVARALHARLGLHAANGAAFFVGAGAATAARWQRVVAWLDSLEDAGACGDEVVRAATDTFARCAAFLAGEA